MTRPDELVSGRLLELAAWLRQYEHDGVEMAPLAVQGMVHILELAAADAAGLEGRRNSAPPWSGASSGNVVPLHPEGSS